MQRRDFFQGSALATAAALGGCAAPAAMQQQRTPFAVPATYIPVAGSDEMFPVRRIYA